MKIYIKLLYRNVKTNILRKNKCSHLIYTIYMKNIISFILFIKNENYLQNSLFKIMKNDIIKMKDN